MTLGKLQANSVISAYQNSTNQAPHASEEAKKLGLKDEQTVGKNESRYELDGTLKEEYTPIGLKKTDKLEKSGEAEESLFPSEKDDNLTVAVMELPPRLRETVLLYYEYL